MASGSLRRHRCPRNWPNITVAVTFIILSAVLLTCMRLSPMALTLPHRPAPAELGGLDINKAPVTTAAKHDKHGGKRTYPQILTLPATCLPTPTSPQDTSRRLIMIGDVHGHLKALEALLEKAAFSATRGDTVVFTGDMVNKGPDSAGVVALAMRIGAFGVRGNHEDHVLRAWERYESRRERRTDDDDENVADEEEEMDETEEEEGDFDEDVSDAALSSGIEAEDEAEDHHPSDLASHKKGKGKKKKGKGKGKGKKKHKGKKGHKPGRKDLATAKSLEPEQRAWLSALPLILRIGNLGPRYGEVLAVHAGLVPGVPLESQDPEAVMTMRTLLPPTGRSSSDDNSRAGHHAAFNSDVQEPLDGRTESRGEEDAHDDEHTRKPMIPSASRKGTPWAKVWTSYYQTSSSSPSLSSSPVTVVYGHDAKAGLRMRRYTFGLDSGCGSNDTLTAAIFEYRDAQTSAGGVGGEEYYEDDEEEEQGGEIGEADDDNGDNGNLDKKKAPAAREGDVQIEGRKQRRKRIRHRLVSVSCADVE